MGRGQRVQPVGFLRPCRGPGVEHKMGARMGQQHLPAPVHALPVGGSRYLVYVYQRVVGVELFVQGGLASPRGSGNYQHMGLFLLRVHSSI